MKICCAKSLGLLFICLLSCSTPAKKDPTVRIRLSQDPESLHPLSYGGVTALQLLNLVYQSLLTIDLKDGSIQPLLAVSEPTIKKNDTLSYFTYSLRPEATWDNGSPVTALDVAFSLKLLNSPLLENERWRAQFEFIKDIYFSKDNPRSFTLVCSRYTPEMKLMTGDFFVLPTYQFDPKGLLAAIPLSLIREKYDSLSSTTTFKNLAGFLNRAALARDPSYIKGSGPYKLTSWSSGQFVTFLKKEDWWGTKVKTGNRALVANPLRLVFHIISDNAAAILALKTKQVHVMDEIPLVPFLEMQKDKRYKEVYNYFSPPSFDLVFVGVNGNKRFLQDNITRQALAHLFNVPQLISILQGGLATQTVGFVHPLIKDFYNSELRPFKYDPKRAENLLKNAGWIKTSSGWQRKKDDSIEKLQLNLLYRAGNSDFENIGLLFQQNAKTIGVKVNLHGMESSQISEKLETKDYDLFIRTLVGNPYSYNLIPLLHSSNAKNGGANVTGFGTPDTDLLLEKIAIEEHQAKKALFLKELQKKMQEESNMIFLYFMKDKIAVSKQIDSVVVSGLQPGYDATRFVKKK